MVARVRSVPSKPHAPATLWTVQWMRAAAALMVVIGHSQSVVGGIARTTGGSFTRSTVLPWGAGVDLFFVISGFIMVHASRALFGEAGAARVFLKRRLARIIPLYWLATTLFLMILAAASLKGGDLFPSAAAILASYAFVPYASNGALAFPVFDLGWTLNYEMFFYAVFAATLATGIGRVRATMGIAVALLAVVLIGAWLPMPVAALRFWTRPIIVDFALGLAVALALAEGVVLPRLVRWAMVAAGVAILCADPCHLFNGPVGITVANGWPRVIVAGLPAALVLAGAVLGPEPHVHRLLAPLGAIGDASYSLYLLHPFVLIAVEKMAQKSAAFRALPGGAIVAGMVGVAIAVALVAHRRLERPLTRWVNARLAARIMPRSRDDAFPIRGAKT